MSAPDDTDPVRFSFVAYPSRCFTLEVARQEYAHDILPNHRYSLKEVFVDAGYDAAEANQPVVMCLFDFAVSSVVPVCCQITMNLNTPGAFALDPIVCADRFDPPAPDIGSSLHILACPWNADSFLTGYVPLAPFCDLIPECNALALAESGCCSSGGWMTDAPVDSSTGMVMPYPASSQYWSTVCSMPRLGFTTEEYIYPELYSSCNATHCDNDDLIVCDGTEVTSIVSCGYGCHVRSSSDDVCYSQFEIGAGCAFDICEGEWKLWPCSGSTLSNCSDCEWGCDEVVGADDQCFGQFDVGSNCTLDTCEGESTLWYCVDGWVDGSSSSCSLFECCEGMGVAGADRCCAEFDVGAPCTNDTCEGETVLWFCGVGAYTGSTSCAFGCDEAADDHRCFGQFEVGANCTDGVCLNETTLLACPGGFITGSLGCPWGCNDGAGQCFGQFDVGANCTLDLCEGETTLWVCSGGRVVGSSGCPFGCDEGGGTAGADQCFSSQFDVGATCSLDVCEGEAILWDCSGGEIIGNSSCALGCNEGAGAGGADRCYSQFEIGAPCTLDTCEGESTLWLCGGAAFTGSSSCFFDCDEGGAINGDLCFSQFDLGAACTLDVCEGETLLWLCTGGVITESSACDWGCEQGGGSSGADRCSEQSQVGGGGPPASTLAVAIATPIVVVFLIAVGFAVFILVFCILRMQRRVGPAKPGVDIELPTMEYQGSDKPLSVEEPIESSGEDDQGDDEPVSVEVHIESSEEEDHGDDEPVSVEDRGDDESVSVSVEEPTKSSEEDDQGDDKPVSVEDQPEEDRGAGGQVSGSESDSSSSDSD